mmetsp:Transcript_12198/g.28602  ORF Transcript_12198/g.28602 Transcript_12198/m.28602 type:complete len:270 (-) Transcript_12198:199-1008(-)|eukprot:CAMPEP_0172614618 /NCGR_PEP_ID=MMETSP1068-20121228/53297_1 /TAXON_ID=35684 /ORGANISM="Pseudopedinella elastica, Strain CCMP716" /LENGTH=269 /DNA_ID=CAMNT_0013419471 /DNA_START=71 /DNA_END=880 /DNA_ORIENTATION=+
MKVLASCTIALNAGLALGFAPRAPLALTRTVRPRSPEFSLTRVQSESDGRSIGAAVSPGGFNSAGEAGIEIRGFSLAKAGLAVGLTLTTLSFGEYFLADGGGAGLGSLGFIYGIPITLIGCALQYAELAPAGLKTTPQAEALFERRGTETMAKIVKDVTRHRYGDEAHLDTTVKALGLVMPQKDYPQLQYIELEESEGGEIAMTCVFQSLDTPFNTWVEPERIDKYDTFFGPGVWCEVVKVSSEEKLVGIKITTGAKPKAAETPAEAKA